LYVDREGNIWATDAATDAAVQTAVKAGYLLRKFRPIPVPPFHTGSTSPRHCGGILGYADDELAG
jgi:hypothetical protein